MREKELVAQLGDYLFVTHTRCCCVIAFMAGEAPKDKQEATEDTGSYWEYDDQFEDFEGVLSLVRRILVIVSYFNAQS